MQIDNINRLHHQIQAIRDLPSLSQKLVWEWETLRHVFAQFIVTKIQPDQFALLETYRHTAKLKKKHVSYESVETLLTLILSLKESLKTAGLDANLIYSIRGKTVLFSAAATHADPDQFWKLINIILYRHPDNESFHFTNPDGPPVIYSADAMHEFVERLDPKKLTTVDKKSGFLQAHLEFFGDANLTNRARIFLGNRLLVNLPEFKLCEEKVIISCWLNEYPLADDELFSIYQFLENYRKKNRRSTIYTTTLFEFFHNYFKDRQRSILIISQSALQLPTDSFCGVVTQLLKLSPNITNVEIHGEGGINTLTADNFKRIYNTARFQESANRGNFTVTVKGGKIYTINFDFFHELLSTLSANLGWKFEGSPHNPIELPEVEPATLNHALDWFKTRRLPMLSHAEKHALVMFVQHYATETSWHIELANKLRHASEVVFEPTGPVTQEGILGWLEGYEEAQTVRIGINGPVFPRLMFEEIISQGQIPLDCLTKKYSCCFPDGSKFVFGLPFLYRFWPYIDVQELESDRPKVLISQELASSINILRKFDNRSSHIPPDPNIDFRLINDFIFFDEGIYRDPLLFELLAAFRRTKKPVTLCPNMENYQESLINQLKLVPNATEFKLVNDNSNRTYNRKQLKLAADTKLPLTDFSFSPLHQIGYLTLSDAQLHILLSFPVEQFQEIKSKPQVHDPDKLAFRTAFNWIFHKQKPVLGVSHTVLLEFCRKYASEYTAISLEEEFVLPAWTAAKTAPIDFTVAEILQFYPHLKSEKLREVADAVLSKIISDYHNPAGRQFPIITSLNELLTTGIKSLTVDNFWNINQNHQPITAFFSKLSWFTNLRSLDISATNFLLCKFSGEDGQEVSALTVLSKQFPDLESLTINAFHLDSYNELAQFAHLKKLKIIGQSKNRETLLPAMPVLEELEIISGQGLPTNLGQALPKLQKLNAELGIAAWGEDVSVNYIFHSPELLARLQFLRIIWLGYKRISVSSENLALPHMKVLRLGNIVFNHGPLTIFAPRLEAFRIYSCQFVGDIQLPLSTPIEIQKVNTPNALITNYQATESLTMDAPSSDMPFKVVPRSNNNKLTLTDLPFLETLFLYVSTPVWTPLQVVNSPMLKQVIVWEPDVEQSLERQMPQPIEFKGCPNYLRPNYQKLAQDKIDALEKLRPPARTLLARNREFTNIRQIPPFEGAPQGLAQLPPVVVPPVQNQPAQQAQNQPAPEPVGAQPFVHNVPNPPVNPLGNRRPRINKTPKIVKIASVSLAALSLGLALVPTRGPVFGWIRAMAIGATAVTAGIVTVLPNAEEKAQSWISVVNTIKVLAWYTFLSGYGLLALKQSRLRIYITVALGVLFCQWARRQRSQRLNKTVSVIGIGAGAIMTLISGILLSTYSAVRLQSRFI